MLTTLSPAARRDRRAVLAGVLGVSALAWVHLVVLARGTDSMSGMVSMREWTSTVYLLTLAMWVVMMVAMMVPSVAPMTVVFAAVVRKARAQGSPLPSVFVFAAGYIAVWSAFSVAATTVQLLFERAMLLSPATTATSPAFGGLLLLTAGAYQLTPLKQACLQNCRSPVEFLTEHWQSTSSGVFALGTRAGIYCLGCCWMLMTLLFVGGVMNLLWVATIAFFVLLEKVLPAGHGTSSIAGLALTLAGASMLGYAAMA